MAASGHSNLHHVSICIPVGRSLHHVEKILHQLSIQEFSGPVVLAWHFEELGREIESHARGLQDGGLDVRMIRGEGRHAPYLRNTAISIVDTLWCLFLDDDVILAENYIDTLTTILTRYPEPIVVQGAPYACANPNSWLARCEARLYRARLDVYREGAGIRICDARNLLIPTAVIRAIGFDEALRFGSEGHTLAAHLIAQGNPIVYAEELQVYHLHRDTLSALARQKFTHGRGRLYADDCQSVATFRRTGIVLGELFWRHGLGPFRYWWTGRIPPNLVPYALMTAVMFCAGMLLELVKTGLGAPGTRVRRDVTPAANSWEE